MRAPSSSSSIVAAAAFSLSLVACPGVKEEEPPLDEPIDLSERVASGEVRAGVIEKPSDLIGGLKAEGRVGDVKLYNSNAAFVVEGIRPGSGYRYFGGNLIDADVVREEGAPGRDLYGETFFAWDLQIFEPREVEIVSDGRDGRAHVRFTGSTAAFAFADDFVRAIIDPPRNDFQIVYDYILGPNDHALTLRITVANPADEPVDVQYPLILGSHGDGAHIFTPPAGFDGSGVGRQPYLAVVSRDISYGLLAADDDIATLFEYAEVSLLATDAFQVPAQGRWESDYYFVVTDDSVAGIQRARRELIEPEPTGTIEGVVSLPETASYRDSWVALEMDGAMVSIAPVREEGRFQVDVPPGVYDIRAFAHSHAPGEPSTVTVAEGDTAAVTMSIPAASRITSSVATPGGEPVHARVTFFRLDDTPSPYAPSRMRVGQAWGSTVSGAAYVLAEPTTIALPAGRYRAVASRGPTWEMDEAIIEVEAGEETSVSLVIEQAVDTTGWISSDMHIHAFLSPDSHVPFETRVKQAATDALDVPLLTEHIWAGRLQETAEALGLDDLVIGISGQEVTTFAYGHFNVFPLELNAELRNQGGVFEHGRTPIELFADMREQHDGDTIIQINHPRGANPGSYFSYIGLDPAADTVERASDWTLDWELIEVFNNSCGGSRSMEVLQDWIGMTNHGHRKGISGTTDSHTERRIPGVPRNWVQVDRDVLRADHSAIVAPMRERRSFVSCGPFVHFAAEDGTGLGGMTGVDEEGKVRFEVRVEAPTWMHVNEVRLLENGVRKKAIDVRDKNGSVLRLERTIEVTPASDAWYAIEVAGSGSMAPVSWSGPPYAITNPIEVDADGDGVWTPPAKQ